MWRERNNAIVLGFLGRTAVNRCKEHNETGFNGLEAGNSEEVEG